MMNLKAFYEERTGATSLANIAGKADPTGGISGDLMTVPDITPYLLWLAGLAQTLTSGAVTLMQFRAPSFENLDIDLSEFEDVGTGVAEFTAPARIENFRYNPLLLTPGEEVQALSANDQATNAEHALMLVAFSNELHNPIPASWKVNSVWADNGSTLVVNTWTNGALTLTQSLKAGYYAVVGMKAISAGLQAARLVFPGLGARPGCIGVDHFEDPTHDMFRRGNLGVWGWFSHKNLPTVDFLSDSADSAQDVILDLVYLGTESPDVTGVLKPWGF